MLWARAHQIVLVLVLTTFDTTGHFDPCCSAPDPKVRVVPARWRGKVVGAERGRGGLFVRKGSEGVGVGVRVSLIGIITKNDPDHIRAP